MRDDMISDMLTSKNVTEEQMEEVFNDLKKKTIVFVTNWKDLKLLEISLLADKIKKGDV